MAKTKRQITPMGKEIKRRLVELEMSQEELATSVGCSPQYINCLLYTSSGREEHAFLTSLAGLLIVLFWIVPYIYDLFETMKSLFSL